MKQQPNIIAEVAQSHDGSLGFAHAFIDLAKDCGASAVKFQTHIASEESSEFEPWRTKFSYKDESRFEYWKRMEFSQDEWAGLKNHCDSIGITFVSSPFSVAAVDLLESIGTQSYKIASGELSNLPMLERINQTRKDVLISSGMSNFQEIDDVVKLFETKQISVFQCTSKYPVSDEEIGLNVMTDMIERYPAYSCGLSDHSGNVFAPLAALALGAQCLEIHLTFHKNAFGPDVPASLDPEQFMIVTEGANRIPKMTQTQVDKDSSPEEFQEMRSIFMKSVYFRRDMTAGTVLAMDDLKILKPTAEIPASQTESVIGRRLKTDSKANRPVKWEMLDD